MFLGTRNNLSPAEQEQAILDAARDEFETHGVRRASVDVIAQRADVSRSTLYRRFPNKLALLTAVGEIQFRKSNRRIEAATAGLGPREAVTAAFCAGALEVENSTLFKRVLSEQMARIAGPDMADQIESAVVNELSKRIAKVLRRSGATMPDDGLHMVSELLIRTMLSYVKLPSPSLDLSDHDATRKFADQFLAPLVY